MEIKTLLFEEIYKIVIVWITEKSFTKVECAGIVHDGSTRWGSGTADKIPVCGTQQTLLGRVPACTMLWCFFKMHIFCGK